MSGFQSTGVTAAGAQEDCMPYIDAAVQRDDSGTHWADQPFEASFVQAVRFETVEAPVEPLDGEPPELE